LISGLVAFSTALVLFGNDTAYSESCQRCHQAGGVGLSGQFPPLLGNPSIDDTDYVVETIVSGLEGEITVMGVTYDGRMSPLDTLDDESIDAVVLYLQSGFASPTIIVPETPIGSDSDGTFPGWVSPVVRVGLLIIVAVGLMVFAPRIVGANDRLDTRWLDAWLKTAVIVAGFVVFVVLVPSWAMQTKTVSGLSRITQDLVGVGLWGAGLFGGLVALWFAQRQERV
jgi:hypothetical protein